PAKPTKPPYTPPTSPPYTPPTPPPYTPPQYTPPPPPPPPPPPIPAAQEAATLLSKYDVNHDGVVTYDESWVAHNLMYLVRLRSGTPYAYPSPVSSTTMQAFVSAYDT